MLQMLYLVQISSGLCICVQASPSDRSILFFVSTVVNNLLVFKPHDVYRWGLFYVEKETTIVQAA
jgi:hypothetical protein